MTVIFLKNHLWARNLMFLSRGMRFKTTPEGAVAFAKASVYLVCSWPPRIRATKSEILRFRVQWWIVLALLCLLFLPLLNGVWVFRHDPVRNVKAILMTSATAQAIMKIIVCRHQRDRLRALHEEMEDFFSTENTFERRILERYVNRCSKFYGFVTICVYLACLGFIIEPMILSQPFPTDSSFPFNVNEHPIYEIVYAQQAIAIFHIAAALSIDSQVAMLIWYVSARFEMLGIEFENSRCENEFNRCVGKHHMLLSYAESVTKATRFIAMATIATTTIGIICGGLTLISHQPLSVKLRVSNMVFNASVELFVYAWPADNLIEMSRAIGERAYNSKWLGKPRSLQKSIVNVIHRSHKPVTISVGGFLPELSLYYYASFLSSSFSYFSTLRIVYDDEA